jgi:hypothetical protein
VTAKEEDELPSREEVEQIVHDERVPWDVRRDLALKYIDYVEDEDPDECGFTGEADRNGFRDAMKAKLKISEGDLNFNNLAGGMTSSINPWGSSLEQDVHQAYTTAKDSYDKIREGDRQADQKSVSDGKAVLAEISNKASAMNAGTANSDTILDSGLSGLKSFDIFVPLYNRAVAKVGGTPGDIAEIHRLYDQERHIPFAKFAIGADEFTKLKESVASSSAEVSGRLNNSLSGWQGAAADQAKRYQEGYEKQTKTVADAGEHSAAAMLTATGSIGKFCRDKAKWVQDYYFDKFGEVTAQDLERIIRIAELEGNASQDDFKHCARFLDQEARDQIDSESCDLNDSTISHIVDRVKEYLKNFCSWFHGHIQNFTLMCANTKNAVDGAWRALSDFFLQFPEDAYVDVEKSSEAAEPKDQGGVEDGGKPGTGSGGNAPGIPEPMQPPKAPDIPKQEGPAPAVNPVTHAPLETDPNTGQPYPIDPVSGASIKDVAPGQDAITVQQGANKISMEEPDQGGKMGISVDDGSGHTKDYKLDFGDDKVQPLPDATHDHRYQGLAGRDPAPGTDDQGSGGKSYQPGPDGKIHILDGALEITAARPDGPGGQTVVTVDDGKGEPTKYTLGEQGEMAQDAAGQQAADPGTDASESTFAQSVTSSGTGLFEDDPMVPGFMDASLGDTAPAGADLPDGSSPQSTADLGMAPGGAGPTGMGMMGGMGAAGGSGEEQERASSGYRGDGGLFDTAEAGGRISGSLDDDSAIGSR